MKVGSVQLIVAFLELMAVAMTFNGGEGAKYKDINYNDISSMDIGSLSGHMKWSHSFSLGV